MKIITSLQKSLIPSVLEFAKEFPEGIEHRFMDDFYKRLFADVEQKRLTQIEERLTELGFTFSSEFMLKEFLKENGTLVSRADKPDFRELYLFAGTPNQVAVASWWETYEFTPHYTDSEYGYKMTLTIGDRPKR